MIPNSCKPHNCLTPLSKVSRAWPGMAARVSSAPITSGRFKVKAKVMPGMQVSKLGSRSGSVRVTRQVHSDEEGQVHGWGVSVSGSVWARISGPMARRGQGCDAVAAVVQLGAKHWKGSLNQLPREARLPCSAVWEESLPGHQREGEGVSRTVSALALSPGSQSPRKRGAL